MNGSNCAGSTSTIFGSGAIQAAIWITVSFFKIDIVRVEVKFKLGQNRSRGDQAKMLCNLQAATDDESRALAKSCLRDVNGIDPPVLNPVQRSAGALRR